MRIHVWHGYLLAGTGSNVYARQLTREWARQGHEVTIFSQEPHPERLDLGGATAVRPDVHGLLPVFVPDHYDGYLVKRLPDCSRAELERWVDDNVAALRAHGPADLVFANHVLLGGPVGARTGDRYLVKAHGSELEYALRGHPPLAGWGREALGGATGTIAGSRHIRAVLREVCGVVDRVHVIPPGVDTELWRPQERAPALRQLLAQARRDAPNPANADERRPDDGNARRLAAFLDGDRPTIVFFGKLSENKGVHLLVEAARGLDARLVIVGFGDDRAELERRAAGLDALFTGPLEHRHLVHLLALADVAVVPSIFPEAFGMVAAEAAAAGCPPVVAEHSGLAEIVAGLRATYPARLAALAGFPPGDAAALHDRLTAILTLGDEDRRMLRAAAREAAVRRWGWPRVARRILELAAGHGVA